MILVVGATGSVGARIVQALAQQGAPVRALVRPATNAGALARLGVAVVRGDLQDPPSLARACAGVRAVITTASASRRGESIEDVDLQGNLNLIDAAAANSVEQLVLVSTVGAAPDHAVPLFRAKGLAEAHLRASPLSHTILQPSPFMDVWFGMMIELPLFSGQPVTLVGEARGRHSFIAEQDVAAFAVAALHHPAARAATIPVGGPAAITFRDAARAYEQALGRPVPVRSVAPGEPIPGLPEIAWQLAAALETYDNEIPMAETARRFGVEPTSVRAFAESRVAALAASSP
ncbi:MAG TPA: SDR family oxidoreductase [Longimicrobiales bacterium]|nr:SDR family oxidoreductase [Longimicrobiales bacterium]